MTAATTAIRPLSADEYFAVTTEGDHTQLVEGALVVDEPRNIHSYIQATLLVALADWTRAAPGRGLVLPPVNVVVDDRNVYGPDLVWIASEDLPIPAGRLAGLPALAVEIRSRSTWRYDIGKKKAAYERRGLRELWFVDDLAETVLVYRRSTRDLPVFDSELELTGGELLASPLLPGFGLRVSDLFGDPATISRR